jgi:hypothetical protein
MYSHLPYFLYVALLLRRRRVLWWRLLLGVQNPRPSACGKMCLFRCLVLSGLLISFCSKIRCNKHWLCYLFHYLSLYVWNSILTHIKECIQFWPKNWVWHWVIGVDTPGRQVLPRVQYGMACLLIRNVVGSVPCSDEWEFCVVTRPGSHGARGDAAPRLPRESLALLWYHDYLS